MTQPPSSDITDEGASEVFRAIAAKINAINADPEQRRLADEFYDLVQRYAVASEEEKEAILEELKKRA